MKMISQGLWIVINNKFFLFCKAIAEFNILPAILLKTLIKTHIFQKRSLKRQIRIKEIKISCFFTGKLFISRQMSAKFSKNKRPIVHKFNIRRSFNSRIHQDKSKHSFIFFNILAMKL